MCRISLSLIESSTNYFIELKVLSKEVFKQKVLSSSII